MAHQFSLFDDDLQPLPPGTAAPTPESAAPAPEEAVAAEPSPDPPELTPEERAARLAVLQQEAAGCVRCELSRSRTNVVFGEGNPAAPLVLVGEGPGENEDATGRPFVGRAGKLLDEVLLRNGMTRRHVYICNTIKCRAANMERGRLLNRPPTPEEIQGCRHWLDQQLGLIRPLVVVCVGAPAANTIIHKNFRILSERGRWYTHSPFAPWTMAVFHPAYVLRLNGPAYEAAVETLVEDLDRARRKVIEVRRQIREAATLSQRTLFD